MNPVHQNHPGLPSAIQREGCYFKALSMLAEIRAGATLTVEQIIELYEWLVEQGHMRDNCFVFDPDRVIMGAQYYLQRPQKAFYIFRKEGDDRDFDDSQKLSLQPNSYIGHSHTGRHGHFWVAHPIAQRSDSDVWYKASQTSWNPYWPAPLHAYEKGCRGFYVA